MDEFTLNDSRIRELECRVKELERDHEKRKRCFALRIKDLDERTVFIGRFMCVGLFLSVIAVVMAALF